jgi:hypothetical protein
MWGCVVGLWGVVGCLWGCRGDLGPIMASISTHELQPLCLVTHTAWLRWAGLVVAWDVVAAVVGMLCVCVYGGGGMKQLGDARGV